MSDDTTPPSHPQQSGFIGLAEQMTALPTLKAVSLCLVFTLCAITWTARDKIVDCLAASVVAHEQAETKRVHATALSDAVVRHRQVEGVMQSVLDDAAASRVELFEFHNGSESLRGVPFLFQSNTAEVVSPGVAPVHEQMQRLPLGTTISWVPEFLAHRCVEQDRDSAPAELKRTMTSVGTEHIVACPVFVNGTAEPTGFVSAVYTHGFAPADPVLVKTRLQDASHMIGATLSAYLDHIGR